MKTYTNILSAIMVALVVALIFFLATGPVVLKKGDPPNNQPNVPSWTKADAKAFPGCSDHKVLGDVIVVHTDASRERLSFDTAWKITHDNNTANDVWVIGWCKP